MAADLDDILLTVDCPRCGATISAPNGHVRLASAFGCSCGALIGADASDSPVAAVQALIDEVAPMHASNDQRG